MITYPGSVAQYNRDFCACGEDWEPLTNDVMQDFTLIRHGHGGRHLYGTRHIQAMDAEAAVENGKHYAAQFGGGDIDVYSAGQLVAVMEYRAAQWEVYAGSALITCGERDYAGRVNADLVIEELEGMLRGAK